MQLIHIGGHSLRADLLAWVGPVYPEGDYAADLAVLMGSEPRDAPAPLFRFLVKDLIGGSFFVEYAEQEQANHERARCVTEWERALLAMTAPVPLPISGPYVLAPAPWPGYPQR